MKPTRVICVREGQWPTTDQLRALPRGRSYLSEDCITYCRVCDKEVVHQHKDIDPNLSLEILYVHPDCHISIRMEMPGAEVKTQ